MGTGSNIHNHRGVSDQLKKYTGYITFQKMHPLPHAPSIIYPVIFDPKIIDTSMIAVHIISAVTPGYKLKN